MSNVRLDKTRWEVVRQPLLLVFLTPDSVSGGFLDHVVARGWGAAAALGPAGPGFRGFRRAGRGAGGCGQAGEIPVDAAGGEPAGLAGAFPGVAVIGGEGAGEAQLGDGGDDDPGPAGELGGGAQGGLVPAQGGPGEPAGVLEAAEMLRRLPRMGGPRSEQNFSRSISAQWDGLVALCRSLTRSDENVQVNR
jgi:hypothetical protein